MIQDETCITRVIAYMKCKKKWTCLAWIGLCVSSSAMSMPQLFLKESHLKSYLVEGQREYDKLMLQPDQAMVAYRQDQDQYASAFFAQSALSETDNFLNPEWSKSLTVGMSKRLPYGMNGKLSYTYLYQRLGATLPQNYARQKVYVPTLSLSYEIDLWKNWMGSFDRSKKDYLSSVLSQSKIHAGLEKKALHNRMRGLYWNLVAQNVRIKIFRDMAAAARRSYESMQSRMRDNVADKGAVAEMSANLSSAEANYRHAKIQWNAIEKRIKSLIPSLQGRRITVDSSYSSVRKAVNQAVQCSNKMGRLSNVPYEYTQFDELVRAMQTALSYKVDSLDRYDSADLKLGLEAASFGFDTEAGEAVSQPFSAEKTEYTATLSLTVPMGLTKTKRQQIANERRDFSIKKSEIDSRFKTSHANLKRTFGLLSEAVDLYHKSIREQEKAFKSTERKFRQGRASVFDYIAGQNTMLNTRLQVLGLEEQLIMEMLSYCSTFNLAPCTFNRI